MKADLVIQTLNVHATSNAALVRDWLDAVVHEEEVDMVALQELTPRHIRAFRDITNYSLLVDRGEPGSAETGWLVRGSGMDQVIGLIRVKRMTRDGWWGWQVQQQHTPRYMAHIILSDPYLSAGSVHTPPGVDMTPKGLTGPRDRRRAWRQYMSNLRRWTQKRQRFLLAGDWNERAAVKYKWSPNWLARIVGANLYPTGTIDYVMYKGMKVVDHKTVETPKGVDHDSHIFYMDFI